jgi:hypothetical protein
LAEGDESFFRVPPERVEQLRRLRKLRERESTLTAQPGPDGMPISERVDLEGSLDTAYSDPLAPPGSSPVTAAFEPVRIESHPPESRDTGWVVVVQEDPQQKTE